MSPIVQRLAALLARARAVPSRGAPPDRAAAAAAARAALIAASRAPAPHRRAAN